MKKIICILSTIFTFASVATAQESSSANNHLFNRGYRADIQLEANTYKQSFLSTSHGFSFGNGFYLGGGAAFGVEYQPDFDAEALYLTSLFADAKYTLTNRHVAPFVALRSGIVLALDDALEGRFFVNPAIGVDFGRIALKVGYMYQTKDISTITFGIGVSL